MKVQFQMTIAAILLTLSNVAAAETVLVETVNGEYVPNYSNYTQEVRLQSFDYEVNAEMGRARLNLNYAGSTYLEDDLGPGSSAVMIAGLTFDKETSQIRYKDSSGKITVCADVKFTKGIFGSRTKIKKTASCFLTTEMKDQSSDDGWKVSTKKTLAVYFNTKN
ncbi:MAG: hypothetical protein K2X47_16520 [Bdellovibrionales bacterium]|nr:hypothetical protein [Bdellovibrionales bacterium]